MVEAGKQIMADHVQDHPLRFRKEGNVNTVTYLDPVEIFVDPGTMPINRTFCKELTPGLEDKCNTLIKKTCWQMAQSSEWINQWFGALQHVLSEGSMMIHVWSSIIMA